MFAKRVQYSPNVNESCADSVGQYQRDNVLPRVVRMLTPYVYVWLPHNLLQMLQGCKWYIPTKYKYSTAQEVCPGFVIYFDLLLFCEGGFYS